MAAPKLKHYINRELIDRLGQRFAVVVEGFDRDRFVTSMFPALDSLELKDRVAAVAGGLAAQLHEDFPIASASVVNAAGYGERPDGWEAWPLAAFIEIYGVDHPESALDAMEVITTYSSCEFAIRPQLQNHPDETFDRLALWVSHPDERVRRLVSEGTRPLLPWASRVQSLRDDPWRSLALLDRLHTDSSETVRRSVANHLNDISRDHPDLALEVAVRWKTAGGGEKTTALLKHGLRTLLKRGNSGALDVLGFTTEAAVEVVSFTCEPSHIEIGGTVRLQTVVRSRGEGGQRLLVDLVVHFVKANGSTSPKVFKWATLDMAPGEQRTLARSHSFRDLSTRTHHAGRHRFVLQVAGSEAATTACEVLGTG